MGDCAVYLPRGIYKVNGVVLSGENVQLRGEGVLKLQENSTCEAALRLTAAKGCRVEWITVDGSREFSHLSTAAAFQIDADSEGCELVDTFARDTKFTDAGPEDGEGYLILGNYNKLTRPRATNCGYGALSFIGDHNECWAPYFWSQGLSDAGIDHGVRAIINKGNDNSLYGGVVDQSAVSFDASLKGHGVYQADPHGSETRASLRIIGTTLIGGNADHDDSGCNCLKIARFDSAYIRGVRIINLNTYHSMRFAEAVLRIHIEDCETDGDIFKENNIEPTRSEVFTAIHNKVCLSAAFRNTSGFTEMNAERMHFIRNHVTAQRFALMDIEDADLAEAIFDGNHLDGIADSPINNIFVNQTDAATMLVGSGKYVLLPNNTMATLGTGSSFTASAAGKRELLTTIDRTARNFEMAAAPVDANVSWRLRDRVYRTGTPAAGSVDYWVCAVAGPGGTGGQWVAHNL
jgi:hypothetical protein